MDIKWNSPLHTFYLQKRYNSLCSNKQTTKQGWYPTLPLKLNTTFATYPTLNQKIPLNPALWPPTMSLPHPLQTQNIHPFLLFYTWFKLFSFMTLCIVFPFFYIYASLRAIFWGCDTSTSQILLKFGPNDLLYKKIRSWKFQLNIYSSFLDTASQRWTNTRVLLP